jgi:hypothetical protein
MYLICRFDTPLNLYDNEHSVFYSLCEKSGINREDIVNASLDTTEKDGKGITLPDETTALHEDEMRDIFTPWIRAWMNL